MAVFVATIVTFIYIKAVRYLKNQRATISPSLKRIGLKKITIALFAALLVATSSYWFIVRPYVTVKNCHSLALNNSGYNKDNWTYWAGNSNAQAKYMFVYEICMHKDGINP